MSESKTEPVICADCGGPMRLRDSRYGKFWGCERFPVCRGTHGAHPDGRPLGKPANRATKQARIRAHAAFDRLWKTPDERRSAYAWITRLMHRDAQVHIGECSLEECEQIERLVRKNHPQLFTEKAPDVPA